MEESERVLSLRQRLMRILLTSTALHHILPEVRLRALIETAYAQENDDDVRAIVVETLCNSSILSEEMKIEGMEHCLNEDWSELAESLHCSSQMVETYGNLSDATFDRFRSMVVSIFTRSRKVQFLPVTRIRQLGALLHYATTIDQLTELTIRSLQESVIFSAADKEAVMNDILDKRYDLLLLVNRFDCDYSDQSRHRDVMAAVEQGYTLSLVQHQNPELENECPVCLGVEVVDTRTPCGHEICLPCLKDWSVVHGEPCPCPMCRVTFSIADCTSIK
mmetsp:Transcript_8960/g.15194  ORF Transcript_8960/g.15194 Transcript_8960/m.15194 type:complete len:277 (-) Transcript_8960:226-1056(-)